MLLLCEDESVIGRAFYVMEFVDGRVLWDQSLPGIDAAERAAIYDEMNRVIAALHSVDLAGRRAWPTTASPATTSSARSAAGPSSTRRRSPQPIEAMDRLIEWLPAHIPASARDEPRSRSCTATSGSTT